MSEAGSTTQQAEITLTSPHAHIFEAGRRSRDLIANTHRDLGHDVTPHYDEHRNLWYIVCTDGQPTHLIVSGGGAGEGFEYHLPASTNRYASFEQMRGTATHVTRYF